MTKQVEIYGRKHIVLDDQRLLFSESGCAADAIWIDRENYQIVEQSVDWATILTSVPIANRLAG